MWLLKNYDQQVDQAGQFPVEKYISVLTDGDVMVTPVKGNKQDKLN